MRALAVHHADAGDFAQVFHQCGCDFRHGHILRFQAGPGFAGPGPKVIVRG